MFEEKYNPKIYYISYLIMGQYKLLANSSTKIIWTANAKLIKIYFIKISNFQSVLI